MTTEQEPARPTKNDQLANTCGIAAIALATGLALYFGLVSSGTLNPPPGLTGIWTITVISLGFVKINTWIVDRRISVSEDRHAAELAEVLEALRALQKAILNEGDQAATEAFTQLEQHLNGRGSGTVARLPRVRPGS